MASFISQESDVLKRAGSIPNKKVSLRTFVEEYSGAHKNLIFRGQEKLFLTHTKSPDGETIGHDSLVPSGLRWFGAVEGAKVRVSDRDVNSSLPSFIVSGFFIELVRTTHSEWGIGNIGQYIDEIVANVPADLQSEVKNVCTMHIPIMALQHSWKLGVSIDFSTDWRTALGFASGKQKEKYFSSCIYVMDVDKVPMDWHVGPQDEFTVFKMKLQDVGAYVLQFGNFPPEIKKQLEDLRVMRQSGCFVGITGGYPYWNQLGQCGALWRLDIKEYTHEELSHYGGNGVYERNTAEDRLSRIFCRCNDRALFAEAWDRSKTKTFAYAREKASKYFDEDSQAMDDLSFLEKELNGFVVADFLGLK